MKEFKERVRLPCDDKKIRSSHEDHLLEALTFFESETEDTTVTARWLYMEDLAVNKYYLMHGLLYQMKLTLAKNIIVYLSNN